jgi:hypothetical protein
MKTKITVLTTALIMLSLLISACGGSEAEATPTLSVEAVQTNAVGTFASGLTQTALAAPTKTPTPTSTLTPTLSAPATLGNVTPFGTSVTGSTTGTACNSLAYVSDVTIPDNTQMTPGQTFTKTWKVRNSGTCAWDAGFKFAFTGGDDAMSGATYTLPQSVPAGTQIDLSIAMTAPNKTGSIRGNWRMSTAAGTYFGDEVYVMITVGGAAAGAATNTSAPAASTATTTPTSAGPPTLPSTP